jgi:hypothetical protein
MSWAAGRKTTRIEDRAYSLLGILGVSMSMLYGEAERAFIRLQEEIMKYSDDSTLFMWDLSAPSQHGLLAPSPDNLGGSSSRFNRSQDGRATAFAQTNKGISLDTWLMPSIVDTYAAHVVAARYWSRGHGSSWRRWPTEKTSPECQLRDSVSESGIPCRVTFNKTRQRDGRIVWEFDIENMYDKVPGFEQMSPEELKKFAWAYFHDDPSEGWRIYTHLKATCPDLEPEDIGLEHGPRQDRTPGQSSKDSRDAEATRQALERGSRESEIFAQFLLDAPWRLRDFEPRAQSSA